MDKLATLRMSARNQQRASAMTTMDRFMSGLSGRRGRTGKRSTSPLQLEQLEQRQVLAAANLLLTEFVAANSGGLNDEDGQSSDWIEIHNADTAPVALSNWYLTDNKDNKQKWAFPAETIQPGDYMVIFASGKNRAVVGHQLHTNFNLSAGGEYLALVYDDPVDGDTVVTEFDPFPAQQSNISYGFDQTSSSNTLIGPAAPVEALVPSVANGGDLLGTSWTQPGFGSAGWTGGTGGVGWDVGSDYTSLIGTNIQGAMDGNNATAYVRYPFGAVDPSMVDKLKMDVNYDDGFIAYLNGTEVARRNAPAIPTWNSNATAEHGGVGASLDFPSFTSMTGLTGLSNSTTESNRPQIVGNRLRLTPSVGSLAGSVFTSNPNQFGGDYSFSTMMAIDVHTPGGSSDIDGQGADGMTFTIQSDGPRVGEAGQGIGLYGAFTRFVAVEFDTWETGRFDAAGGNGTHIGIDTSQAANSIARTAVGAIPRFNGGAQGANVRYAWIDYDGATDLMSIYFGNTSTKPASPVLTGTVDFNAIFENVDELYLGFTAGTGGATNAHDVLEWHFQSQLGDLGTKTETIDISQHIGLLNNSSNVLAFHALNRSAADNDPNSTTDRDFLIKSQLTATILSDVDTDHGRYYSTPSPGAPNGIGTAAPSRPVTFSRAGGTFTAPFQVSLSAVPGAQIRYTTNGTVPTATSTLYTTPITITNSTQLRAVAIEPGGAPSKPVTQNYIALSASVQNFESNLPIIVLDSFAAVGISSTAMTYVGASIIDTGPDGIARITDPADYAGRGGIRYRGQTSQGFPKPHFAYETWDEDNGDESVSLLGFNSESDWVLNNPYSEKPLMQNYLAYHWFDETGEWSVSTRFVEVFANFNGDGNIRYDLTSANGGNAALNDYLGVYIFMEKIKIDDNRVDVDKLLPTDNTAPNVTGGYIYKRDKADEGAEVTFTSSQGILYRVHDPDITEMTPAQQTYLGNFVNQMESVIYGANFTDPVNGYAKYIDVDSWIDHWIMVEMTKNIDGFRLSTYYTKERDQVDPETGEVTVPGRVIMGPVWDYNLSLGNADYLLGNQPTGWYHSQNTTLNSCGSGCLGDTDYIYFRRLFQDPNFAQKVTDRWQELRSTVFSDANILADVNNTIALLTNGNPNPGATNDPTKWTDPITRNYSRWRVIGTYLWPNGFVGATWNADVTWMRDTFLIPRLHWIDSQWIAAPTANQNGGLVPEGFGVTLTGTTAQQNVYYTKDGSDPRQPGTVNVVPGVPATTLLVTGAPLKWKVPADNTLAATWMQKNFDDSTWGEGTSGIGYERSTGYEGLLGTNINAEMATATTFYTRMHFNVANTADVNKLTLAMKYDDGYVAYINGVEVARRNFTGTPAFNSVATDHPDGNAVVFEDVDITAFRNQLVNGDNVVAIHGMNSGSGSSDLLILPEIRINGTPDVITVIPAGLSPSAVQYTGPITVNDNTRIIARTRNTSTGLWSGPFDATYITQVTPLVVTEINYNPAPPAATGPEAAFVDNDDFEFIELRNVGTEPLDLDNVRISDGVDFTFTSGTLNPGERTVVVRNQAAFEARYGTGHNIAGVYLGSLNNDGEHIQVLGPIGELAMDFTYDDSWYALTDGDGYSLVIVNDAAAPVTWGSAASWRISDYYNGSPNTGDTGIAPAQGSIRINELLLDTASPTGQRIELYNTTSGPIDVSGFYLTDDYANLTKYRLPLGMPAIAAGGYLVLDGATTFGAALPLSKNGAGIGPRIGLRLHSADAGGVLTGFETNEDFTAAEPEVSQGWYIKSDGFHDFTAQSANTFGAANAAPKVGPVVINEVMYNPADLAHEFVELLNISGASVSLNDWSFGAGIDYTFGNVTLAPGEHLVVSPIDPATFRSTYGVPASVQIVGPYLGALDNAGEDLWLAKPNATLGAVRVDRVNYDNADPWPTLPAGNGPSLARITSTAYGNDVANWGSEDPGGSPGGVNSIYDETPPSVPTGLTATVQPGNHVLLAWNASNDAQSSVHHYNIYRGDSLVGTSATLTFTDTITDVNQTYSYTVSAANVSLVESAKSTAASARILVVSNADIVTNTSVRVQMNSTLNPASAQNAGNYFIAGVTISAATLEASNNSVLLTTSALTNGQPYRVVVNGLTSAAGAVIQPNSNAVFVPGAGPGLRVQFFNEPNSGADSTDLTKKLLPANLVQTRVDPIISYSIANGVSFDPVNFPAETDFFSSRANGKVKSMAAGNYTFTVVTSDGARFWVWPEGEAQPATPTIDKWTSAGSLSKIVPLLADTKYNIVFEWYEHTSAVTARLSWTVPDSTTSVVIPASQFSQPVTLETIAPVVSKITVANSGWAPAFVAQLQAQGLGTGGVDVPLGGTSPALPWSNLNQVKVKFDSDVVVGAGSLSVGGVNVASYGVTNFSYDYTTFTGTWTLAQPIDLDRATISVAAGVTDLAGNTVSGARSGGVRVASGDVNGDGSVSAADRTANVARQMTSIGHASYATAHDINGDGVINIRDLVALQYHMDQSAPAPAPAAAAALVYRVDASPEGSTAAQPLRAARRAVERRDAAAADRALSARTETPVISTTSNATSSLRARRTARAAASAVDALFGDASM